MRYILGLLLALLVAPASAADNTFPTPGNALASGAVNMCVVAGVAVPCGNVTTPMQVAGTFSASLGGFTPSASGARGTPVSVTTSDSSGTLPTGAVVAVTNVGANPMYCNVNGIAATTSDQYISTGGGWFAFTIPAAITTLHCIATGGTTTANTVGGSGLPTGTGGGGGSGGGAVTVADGSDVAEGAKADAAWVSGSGSVVAILKNIAGGVAGAIPAGTALIGKVGIDQTTPGTTNAVSVQYGSTASVADPCQTATKVYTPINVVTATNTIITGVAAKKKYICGIFLYPAGADNIAIFQATTATSCATALVGVIGGTTTATGIVATAQAGFVLGNGASAVAATTVNQTDLCIVTSAAVQLSGVVVTVDQ